MNFSQPSSSFGLSVETPIVIEQTVLAILRRKKDLCYGKHNVERNLSQNGAVRK